MTPLLTSWVLGVLLVGSLSLAHADIDCDGVDDLLTTGLALSNFVTDSEATVMAWIKSTNAGVVGAECWESAVATGDNGGYLALGRLDDTNFCGYLYDGSVNMITSASTATWYHLALKTSGNTLGFYVDGLLISTLSVAAISDLSGTVSHCGNSTGVGSDRLADIRYYAVAVPDAEIASIAQSRLRDGGRTLPSAYWPLNDCADGGTGHGLAFVDRSGNGRTTTGNDGADNLGVTCRGSEVLRRAWGAH